MKTTGKLAVYGGAAALVIGGGIMIASADQPQEIPAGHSAGVSIGCADVRYSANNYEGPDNNNLLTLYIDGAVVVSRYFSNNAVDTIFFTDKYVKHTVRLTVDANIVNGGDPTIYDIDLTERSWPCDKPVETTTTVEDTTTTTSTTIVEEEPCQEDDPCWDCETMGNQICNTTSTSTTTTEVAEEETPTSSTVLPGTTVANTVPDTTISEGAVVQEPAKRIPANTAPVVVLPETE